MDQQTQPTWHRLPRQQALGPALPFIEAATLIGGTVAGIVNKPKMPKPVEAPTLASSVTRPSSFMTPGQGDYNSTLTQNPLMGSTSSSPSSSKTLLGQ